MCLASMAPISVCLLMLVYVAVKSSYSGLCLWHFSNVNVTDDSKNLMELLVNYTLENILKLFVGEVWNPEGLQVTFCLFKVVPFNLNISQRIFVSSLTPPPPPNLKQTKNHSSIK